MDNGTRVWPPFKVDLVTDVTALGLTEEGCMLPMHVSFLFLVSVLILVA